MTKKISQRSAIKLKRRVKELEAKVERWNDTLRWGWGTPIDKFTLTDLPFTRIKTASLLSHGCLVRPTGKGNEVEIKAVRYV